MVLQNDREAIQLCIKTCTDVNHKNIRIVRIANSLKVEHILLSESYYEEAKMNPFLEIETEPQFMEFDKEGNIVNLKKI